MAYPETAAFDPVFFLHHANVDRLLAMWQVLYPESYIVPTVNEYGTYYELVGTIDRGNSSLAPFHSDNGSTLFTSDGVRSMSTFGYSYPELPDLSMNATALADSVRTTINTQYNPSLNSPTKRTFMSNIWHRSANLAASFSNITLEDALTLGVNSAERQWYKIMVNRFAYNTSFSIDFFMGDPPSDVALWAATPNLIATHGQFIATNVSMIHPDGPPDGALHGEISLTHTLVAGRDRGLLADLTPQNVIPLLQRGLVWRARTADGCKVDVQLLKGLTVSVGSRSLTSARLNSQFPRYGSVQWHTNVTQSKPCGARR